MRKLALREAGQAASVDFVGVGIDREGRDFYRPSPMKRPHQRWIVCCALAALGVGAFCRADEPAPDGAATAGERFVLLRNGELLQGQTREAGEKFFVRSHGAEVQLTRGQIDFSAPSLDAVYHQLRDRTRHEDALGQTRLAQWCLRQGLKHEAAQHVAVAAKLAPGDAKIAYLQRRIELADETPRPLPRPRAASEAKSATPAHLPTGSIETFAKVVQPILLNSCQTGGCHGARCEQSWKLTRVSPGRTRSHRLTQRNLQACLEAIDCESVCESPLLAKAAAPHAEGMLVGLKPQQLELLRQWIYAVSGARGEGASAYARRESDEPGAMPRATAALAALKKRSPGREAAATPGKGQDEPTEDGPSGRLDTEDADALSPLPAPPPVDDRPRKFAKRAEATADEPH